MKHENPSNPELEGEFSQGDTEDGMVRRVARKKFKTERQKLDLEIRSQALKKLNVERCSCDGFAEKEIAQEPLQIDRHVNAWTFDWGIISKECPRIIQLIVNKIVVDGARVVLCTLVS